ncbi:MAG: DUF4451 domain-containing protein [Staphylococcus equorum]|nr:DUF4451 domain-containing protein [Staphylococcus equorum]
MSYAPLINLDEIFGMIDVGWDQLHQTVNFDDGLLDEDFQKFEIMEHDEGLNKHNYFEVHNNNNNINFDRQDSVYEKCDIGTIQELNGYDLPHWRKEGNYPENLDKLERFSTGLFDDLIGIEYQIEQHECNKTFDFVSDMTLQSNEFKFDESSDKKFPKILQFDYDDINIDQKVVACKLVNLAANPISESALILILSRLNKRKESEEERIFSVNRTRYTRANIGSLSILHPNVQYQRNTQFSIDKPYEPEYIRVQMNPVTNAPFNETRCGLCPYCPSLVFKNLKTSTYAQHLSLTHGIQTDNYITPNPLLYGSYNLKKNNTNRKTRAHISEKNGVICPVCHDIVETECSKTTATRKPLNNYLRHFKEKHRKRKEKNDPIKFFSKFSTNRLKLFLMLSNI